MSCEAACEAIGSGTVCSALSTINEKPCNNLPVKEQCSNACNVMKKTTEGQSFIDSMTRAHSENLNAQGTGARKTISQTPEPSNFSGDANSLIQKTAKSLETAWPQIKSTFKANAAKSKTPAALANETLSVAAYINPQVGTRTKGLQAGKPSSCISLPNDSGLNTDDGLQWYYYNAIMSANEDTNVFMAVVGAVRFVPMAPPACAAKAGTWETIHGNNIMAFKGNLYLREPSATKTEIYHLDSTSLPMSSFPATIPTGSSPLKFGVGLAGITSNSPNMSTFRLRYPSPSIDIDIDLTFSQTAPPIPNSNCIPALPFYYSFGNLKVTGEIKTPKKIARPVTGTGWFDHQTFQNRGSTPIQRDIAAALAPNFNLQWDWLSASLNDGTAFWLARAQTNKKPPVIGYIAKSWFGMIRKADGTSCVLSKNVKGTINEIYTDDDGNKYPLSWSLSIPGIDIVYKPQSSSGLLYSTLQSSDGKTIQIPGISEIPSFVIDNSTNQKIGFGWVERNGRQNNSIIVEKLLDSMGQSQLATKPFLTKSKRGWIFIVLGIIVSLGFFVVLLLTLIYSIQFMRGDL